MICRLPLVAPPAGDPFATAFAWWVHNCRLSQWVPMHLLELNPDEGSIARVPLIGMSTAMPEADISHHGRQHDGILWHGTCFSHLPSILSSGTLLRCNIPTRGHYAVWAAESRARSLQYSPAVKLNGMAVQCTLMLRAKRIKNSHFKTTDKQFMIRECWHEVMYLYVCKHSGEPTYRGVHPLGAFLPKFVWSPSFSNWNQLPEPWNVVTNEGAASSSRASDIPEIPT